jgi:hypothetical protein
VHPFPCIGGAPVRSFATLAIAWSLSWVKLRRTDCISTALVSGQRSKYHAAGAKMLTQLQSKCQQRMRAKARPRMLARRQCRLRLLSSYPRGCSQMECRNL